MSNNLSLLITTFLSSNEKNIQLDFFRSNEHVLFQIYKQYDVNKWELDFSSTDINSSVIEICFHENKKNNEENFIRFSKSTFHDMFTELEKNSFFYRIHSKTSVTEIVKLLLRLIDSIYDLNDERIEFTLNVY